MAGTTAEAQVQKKCYKNQTAGWLGVVKVDHLGAQQGAPVAPFGTVYLTDDEAILTARAPANPKDNPFEEQGFMFVDDTGKQVEQTMRPLILVTDDEGAPGDDRYVPVGDINPHVLVAQQVRTNATLDEQDASPRTVPTDTQEPTQVAATPLAAVDPAHAVPAPVAAAPVEQAQAEGDEETDETDRSWVENPERTPEPQRGSLGGSDTPVGPTAEADPAAPGAQVQSGAPPQQPAPTSVGSSGVQPESPGAVPSESAGTGQAAGAPSEQGAGEEHAGVTKAGEETGAAETPVGTAPEGEYASHEEVGSPDAPTMEST